jgi:peptidyl-prolyl cis-trans isomerase D
MISWIQRYFQHHFKVIFAVLLGVIIISFVFTIGAAPGLGSADRRMVDRPFFGYNLSLQSDQEKIGRNAQLSFSLNPRYEFQDLQNYALYRVASLHLADQWHIPETTTDEITERIKTMPAFFGADRQFDAKAYQTFRDNLKTNAGGVTEADIVRVIGDDVRVEKVQKLLSGPGYVLPAEIKTQLAVADTSWTVAVANADYNAFKPEIKPTDTELAQFFEQSGARYDIPPRVVVSYVEFPTASFAPSVNVTEMEVRAFYDANPARFPKPSDPTKPATPSVTLDPSGDFALVRPQVEAALKQERAQKLAAQAASDLQLAIFNAQANLKSPEAVEQFLASKKLTAKTLPPFTREAAPAELGGSPQIAAEAFRLGKEKLTSDVIPTPVGAAILIWKETQPSRKPLFTEVRDKVAADYVENERRKRFVELGKTVKAQLEARLKGGDTLEKAAAAAGTAGIKLETKTLPAFTLRSPPQDIDYSVLGTLERLEKGQVSDMVIRSDKGVFVYAIDKKVPDISDANPQFAETRKQIASNNARFGGSSYIFELIEKELKKSEPRVQ